MAQTTVDTLLIKIQADMAGLQKEMSKVKGTVQKGSSDINKSLSSINSKISSSISTFTKLGVAIGAAFTGMAIRNIVKVGSDIENLQIRLEKMFGSAEQGALAFQGMSEFASQVPFSLQQIQQGSGSLAAVARDAEHLNQLLEITGNVAAVSGLDFATTAMQIQRSFSAGISAADLFRERAVGSLLGFEQGAKVSVDETVKRFEEAFSGDGEFAGTTKELAKTLTGTLSMIGDKIFNFQRLIADKGFFNEVKSQFQDLDDTLAENEARFKQLAEDIALLLVDALRGLVSALKFVQDNSDDVKFAMKALLVVILGYKAITAITAIVLGLKSAMMMLGIETKKTGSIFKRNPIGLLITGMTVLTAGVLGAREALKGFNTELARSRDLQGTLNPFLGISENIKSTPTHSQVMSPGAREPNKRRLKFEELSKEVTERMRLLQVTESQRRLEKLIGDENLGANHKQHLLELIKEEIQLEKDLEAEKERKKQKEKSDAAIEKARQKRLEDAISLTERVKTEEQLLTEEMNTLNQAIREFGIENIPNANLALEQMEHELKMMNPVMITLANTVDRAFDGIASSIADSMTEGKSAMESFRSVALNIVNELIREFTRLQLAQLKASMFGAPSGGGGGILSSIIGGVGGLISGGIGNSFGMGRSAMVTTPVMGNAGTITNFGGGNQVMGFRATGGTVAPNTPTMVGERGPEVFVPNTSGRIMNSNMTRSMSGGGVVVNQHINVETGVAQTVQAEMMNLLPSFKAETIAAVAESRLRGGEFASAFGGSK